MQCEQTTLFDVTSRESTMRSQMSYAHDRTWFHNLTRERRERNLA